jgi:uncharacterized protein (DUF302 family)
MPVETIPGFSSKLSKYSVDETVDRFQSVLKKKSVTLFAFVDHSGEAAKAGLRMPPTKLLIFGNPAAGTPLMLASPSIAIDLPLKVLVAEDVAGKVWVSFNDPQYLAQRHQLPSEFLKVLAVVEVLVDQALA